MARNHSFLPVSNADAHVLILGSMPGRKSLEKQEYYALPQNVFWKIMGELVGAGQKSAYKERLRLLKSSGIALWDVLASCERDGSSLDSRIKKEVANNFTAFFKKHPHITKVFFNGSKAEQSFRKLVQANEKQTLPLLKFYRLPSTSPAHAGKRYTEKLHEWRAIINS